MKKRFKEIENILIDNDIMFVWKDNHRIQIIKNNSVILLYPNLEIWVDTTTKQQGEDIETLLEYYNALV